MRNIAVFVAVVSIVLWTVECSRPAPVLLVSFDGYRWDYHNKAKTPVLNKLVSEGAQVERLIPSYPSKTFPNHYTLVTGKYPENHGIVGNSMYDPTTGEKFDMKHSCDGQWWEGGDPLWVHAKEKGLRTATYFWPGSDCEIHGIRADYFRHYDQSIPYTKRIDTVIEWLQLPEAERPDFITLYYHEPDSTGHEYGPSSEQIIDTVQQCDEYLGELLKKLQGIGWLDKMNIIVTADHGMTDISNSRQIFLEDYIDMNKVILADDGPLANIFPVEGASTADLFRKLQGAHPNATTYMKEDMPDRLHFDDSPRVGPIVMMADLGWTIQPKRTGKANTGGSHGYDNKYSDMHAIFVGRGPAFHKGAKLESMANTDVTPLINALLGIGNQEGIDGSLDTPSHLLNTKVYKSALRRESTASGDDQSEYEIGSVEARVLAYSSFLLLVWVSVGVGCMVYKLFFSNMDTIGHVWTRKDRSGAHVRLAEEAPTVSTGIN